LPRNYRDTKKADPVDLDGNTAGGRYDTASAIKSESFGAHAQLRHETDGHPNAGGGLLPPRSWARAEPLSVSLVTAFHGMNSFLAAPR
jgi:hypothetical protein